MALGAINTTSERAEQVNRNLFLFFIVSVPGSDLNRCRVFASKAEIFRLHHRHNATGKLGRWALSWRTKKREKFIAKCHWVFLHHIYLFLYKVPFLGRNAMFSGRMPVSRENCLNFSSSSGLRSMPRPVKPHKINLLRYAWLDRADDHIHRTECSICKWWIYHIVCWQQYRHRPWS